MSQNTQIVRLGDASIASPFTCRQSSIYPTIKVIQQGRCTLVTMLQIYKIQALTCLSLAYCLSALYVDGVKLGDSQMTLSGIFSAILFLVMSHAKPLQTLAPTRPPATILCFYVLFTVAGQFAVHMYTLWASIDMTRPHIVPGWVCSPESTNSTLAKEVRSRPLFRCNPHPFIEFFALLSRARDYPRTTFTGCTYRGAKEYPLTDSGRVPQQAKRYQNDPMMC